MGNVLEQTSGNGYIRKYVYQINKVMMNKSRIGENKLTC